MSNKILLITVKHVFKIKVERKMNKSLATLTQNPMDVGSIPTLGTIFPIFITPLPSTALIAVTMTMCKLVPYGH